MDKLGVGNEKEKAFRIRLRSMNMIVCTESYYKNFSQRMMWTD